MRKTYLALTTLLVSAFLKAEVDNGFLAKKSQFPNVVKIFALKEGDNSSFKNIFYCTGTLIAPHIVLTAAHCAKTPSYSTLYVSGPENIHGELLKNKKPNGVRVKKIFKSQSYNLFSKRMGLLESKLIDEENRLSKITKDDLFRKISDLRYEASKHDIAILVLEKNHSICEEDLAQIQCIDSLNLFQKVQFAGFGYNGSSNRRNDNPQGELLWGENFIFKNIPRSFYMVNHTYGDQLTNSGDSGGPLFVKGNNIKVYGITVLKIMDQHKKSIGATFLNLTSSGASKFFRELNVDDNASVELKNILHPCLR